MSVCWVHWWLTEQTVQADDQREPGENREDFWEEARLELAPEGSRDFADK